MLEAEKDERPFRTLCQEYGISRKTGYKWLYRYQDCRDPRVLVDLSRSDNGPPFASTGLGGLTELSAWWIRLGIRHERIEPGKPQQNGRLERMHLTLKKEACTPPSVSVSGQQGIFDRFRKRYNEERPHEALEYKVPLDLYAASDKLYSIYEHGSLYSLGVENILVDERGKIKWKNHVLKVGVALKNELVDVHMLQNRRWSFSYGPVVLGTFDETNPKGGLIQKKKCHPCPWSKVFTMFRVAQS